jgi:hypothetical protein
MSFTLKVLKRFFFWSYPRTSWQWDVLCVVILVFIFLTPKSWFDNAEFRQTHLVLQAPSSVVVMDADVIGTPMDTAQIERRARQLSGHPDAQVTRIQERRDADGRLIGYDVDIRW